MVFSCLSLVLISCGMPFESDNFLSNDPTSRNVPSFANFKSWAPIWRKGSWIVALENAEWTTPNSELQMQYRSLVQAAMKNAANSFLHQMESPTEQTRSLIQGLASTDFHLEFINQRSDLPLPESFETDKAPLTFLVVELKDTARALFFMQELINSQPYLDLGSVTSTMHQRDSLMLLAQLQASALNELPGVSFIEPDLYSYLTQAASDPQERYLPIEFEFNSGMARQLREIKADLAYNFAGQGTENRRPINIAVLDTGVDYAHPDLKNQMWVNEREVAANNVDDDGNGVIDDIHGFDASLPMKANVGIEPRPGAADLGGPGATCPDSSGRDQDPFARNCGHGTHVAGIIAAEHGGDPSTLGVCPNCRIMSVRVAERCLQPDTQNNEGECVLPQKPLTDDQYEVDGGIADSAQIRALQYLFNTRSASNPASLAVNIVNMSLGKYFKSRSMSYLLTKLQESNVVITAAAGNDDTDTPSFPAAYDSVVAVCATGGRLADAYGKAVFSNFGEWVDICAPGYQIEAPIPGVLGNGSGRKTTKQGTSQATPFVAGAIGYLMSISPTQKDAKQFIDIIKKAANYNDLYFSRANLIPGSSSDSAYLACYKDGSSCDYLLGTGFLNLYKAVNPQAAEPFSDVDLSRPLAVSDGCVVSSIGSRKFSWIGFWGGLPALLMLFAAIVRMGRKTF